MAIRAAAFILVGAPGIGIAEGPVDPLNLPGGVVVTDADPGNGEQWGRASGRDINYAVNDPDRFFSLGWGNVDGTVPGAAFDNSIDGILLLGENLSFNAGISDLENGIARWSGEAQITLVGPQAGVYTLPTRFTMTVTDHTHAPVPLAVAAGEVDPGIDVKNDTNGTFNVNLFFEAFYPVGIPAGSSIGPGNNTWWPLLDLFDALDTGVGQDGFAHTGVSTGFYYTLSGPGLTLEQHDQTVHEVLAEIFGDTGYLRIEVPARLIGIEEAVKALATLIQEVKAALGAIEAMIGDVVASVLPNLATRDDVKIASQDLSELFLIALGILPIGGTFPDDIDIGKIPYSGVAEQDSIDALQAALDDETRWCSDDEMSAQTTTLVTKIEENQDILEDEKRFTDDNELAAQTNAIVGEIDGNEGKINELQSLLSDETRFTDDSELSDQTQTIVEEIDQNEAKLDQILAKLDDDEYLTEEEFLAFEIEKALLLKEKLSYLYLPEDYGGRLEMVRAVIEEVITNNEAAGVDIGKAWGKVDKGDAFYDNAQWKKAFHEYRGAYLAVISGNG